MKTTILLMAVLSVGCAKHSTPKQLPVEPPAIQTVDDEPAVAENEVKETHQVELDHLLEIAMPQQSMTLTIPAPCENGQLRVDGICPPKPDCPQKCILGADPALIDSCWSYYDYTKNDGQISLSNQRVNGVECAWSY